MHRISKEIHNTIEKADKILLIPHANPDLDALGSVGAFSHYLRSLGKKSSIFCVSSISDHYKTLPYIESITNNLEIWSNFEFDLIIVFDSVTLSHTGITDYVDNIIHKPHIINIDHHAVNAKYGRHNLVMENTSSTTELLYYYFAHNNIYIDQTMATSLLAGIIFDTNFFTNGGTTMPSFKVASRLIKSGGDIKLVKNILFKNKTVDSLKLWGVVLSRIKKHETLDIVYTYVTQKDIQQYNAPDEAAEGFANFMNNICEGKVGLIFKENKDGKIKGSFRTIYDDIDVSAIAKSLGGGGHRKAAGFTIDGPLQKAAKEVFDTITINNYIKE